MKANKTLIRIKPIFNFVLWTVLMMSQVQGALQSSPDLGYVSAEGKLFFAFKKGRHIIFRVCADNVHYLGETVEEARKNCKRKEGIKDIAIHPSALARELPSILALKMGGKDGEFVRRVRDILNGDEDNTKISEKLNDLKSELERLNKSRAYSIAKHHIDRINKREIILKNEILEIGLLSSNLDSEVDNLKKIIGDVFNPDKLTMDTCSLGGDKKCESRKVLLLDIFKYFRENITARYGIDQDVKKLVNRFRFRPIISDSTKQQYSFKDIDGEEKVINGVKFQMGAGPNDKDYDSDGKPGNRNETAHTVYLDQNFSMGRIEVSQRQWYRIIRMAKSKGNDTYDLQEDEYSPIGRWSPINRISIPEIKSFIKVLNKLTIDSGHKYDLPTEAQWEFASRGIKRTKEGVQITTDPFPFKESVISEYAIFDHIKSLPSYDYGKKSNAFGLYVMHGNVAELTKDLLASYSKLKTKLNPLQDEFGTSYVVRGGSLQDESEDLRCASRAAAPSGTSSAMGFRLVKMARLIKVPVF